MEQKKPKVDIKAIMAKMKEKTKQVKSKTEQVKSLVGSSKPSKIKPTTVFESKTKKEAILIFHKQGLTLAQIIERTKFKYSTVFCAINDNTVKEMYKSGKSVAEIAKKLGKEQKTIIKWLKKWGLIK